MAGVKVTNSRSFTNNGGTISGDAYGVIFYGPGVPPGPQSVTNLSGGMISASGIDGVGVTLDAGGTVNNDKNASITAMGVGVKIVGGAGDVTNSGTIVGKKDSAIELTGGGTVTNNLGGVIAGGSGFDGAIDIGGGSGGVVNSGLIKTDSADAAVDLSDGGTLTNFGRIVNSAGTDQIGAFLVGGGTVHNQAGGKITCSGSSATAIMIVTGAGTVENAGLLKANTGVNLQLGGTVTNHASGEISAVQDAVSVTGAKSSVTNFGTISSVKGVGVTTAIASGAAVDNAEVSNQGSITGAFGVFMASGGTVTNKVAGTITGAQVGVGIFGPGSVTDAGSIDGAAFSVEFEGAGKHKLTLETGASLSGVATGSTAKKATNAVVLQGHGIAQDGFVHFNTLSVEATGTWALGGDSTIGKSTILTGALDIAGELTTRLIEQKGTTLRFAEGGKLTLRGSSVLSGSVTGKGSIDLNGNARATLYGEVGAGDTFAYADANARLVLDDLDVGGEQLFNGMIAGFGRGDILDAGAPFGAGTTLHFTENAGHTAGMLTLTHGTIDASLTLLGSYVAHDFHIAGGDGHGGSLITYG